MKSDYNWENHFDLAKDMFSYLDENNPMANTEKAEALARSIIHLAYYSCMNITKNKNEKYGQRIQNYGAGAHDATIREIKKYENTDLTDEELNIIMSDLLTLKDYRTISDYKADQSVDFYVVREIIDLATDVYESLIKL